MTVPTRDHAGALALLSEPTPTPTPVSGPVTMVPARSPERNSDRPPQLLHAVPQRMVDVFLRYLEEEGVRHVFAIPGGLLHPLMAAVEADESLTLVMPKHEEGAAFMADGYARTT